MKQKNGIYRSLSMFPFFGGKALLAPMIADLLDYVNTTIYVEPFGGGARVLLNKPRHGYEIYNDGSESLCAFMRVMSNRDTAMELIHGLYDTEFSEEQFNRARDLCAQVDDSEKRNAHYKEYKYWKSKVEALVGHFSDEVSFEKAKPFLDKAAQINTVEAREALEQYAVYCGELSGEYEYQFEPCPFSDMEIATALFIMYTQGRDGMGNYFSSVKFDTQEAYYKRIDRLYDAAERLEGVKVLTADAELFFIKEAELFTRPDVMAYLDPPYLADVKEGDSKNLGGVYRQQMERKRHEFFLSLAQKAQCKMVISNYDNEVYNEYLKDWTRIDVPVTTSVGGKKNNKRVEVLWYNY